MVKASALRTVASLDTLGKLHHRGHLWVERHYLPAVRALSGGSTRDRRRAAEAYHRLGDLHDLNGTPRAAIRAYARSLELCPRDPAGWHALGATYESLGELRRARHALARAALLAPGDDLLAVDRERVEWAMLHGCPALYDGQNVFHCAMEAVAARRFAEARALLGGRRSIRARQIRSRIHAIEIRRGRVDVAKVLAAWQGVARCRGPVQLQHADWYYTFFGPAGDSPDLWRLLLWRIRGRLEGGVFPYSASFGELDVGDGKRFELWARYELARCERDVPALLALAASYPGWREPFALARAISG